MHPDPSDVLAATEGANDEGLDVDRRVEGLFPFRNLVEVWRKKLECLFNAPGQRLEAAREAVISMFAGARRLKGMPDDPLAHS